MTHDDLSRTLRLDDVKPGTVALLGVAFEENSSFLRGTAGGPAGIRAVLHSPSGNLCAESGLDLSTPGLWTDVGDLRWPGDSSGDAPGTFSADTDQVEAFFGTVRESVGLLLDRQARVLVLGGDHSITYPVMQAVTARHSGLTILHLDAHPDLYDSLDGQRLSHASPFARIMEDSLATRLVQVGIRTLNPHQREQAARFGVEIVEMKDWHAGIDLHLEGPLYVSIDMDCLDPAFAPGVSHHEPGGFTTRDVLSIIQSVKVPVVGADLVEFNPDRDPVGVTAAVASKLTKELLALLIG